MRLARSVATLGLVVALLMSAVPAAPAPDPGTLTIGVHVTVVNRWLDPGDAEGLITPFMLLYLLHDALKEPWADFMAFYGTSATGAGWIVPKKYIEKVGEEGFKKAPVGAGPYKLAGFNPGVEATFEAFPDYWRKAPSVKRIVMRSIPDESTRAAALKTGEVDSAYLFGGPIT